MWEERRLGLLVGCGVVTEAVENALGLDRFAAMRFSPPLTREALAGKRRLIEQMASALARLHKKGVLHRDLKASNVLIQAQGEGVRIVFLDLDAVRFKSRVSQKEVVLNLAQLDASMASTVSRSDRARFLVKYWGGHADRKRLRALKRQVRNLSEARQGGPA
jgi:serine/threonine protein kinase